MQYLIGIDAGTTNQKAILFDENGTIICQSRRPSPLTTFPDGSAVYDAGAVWGQICALLREITSGVSREILGRIAGIAVTGMAEAGVPLSKSGEPLYPFIAWYDARTAPYAAWWNRQGRAAEITEITGLRVQHIFSVNKLMWIRDHLPDVYERMSAWACMEDFIAFRLSGVLKMDVSIGSRTMMMDLEKRCWSSDILKAAGISPDVLPELVSSGSFVGRVTERASAETGLLSGTPVYAGGHDHVCGALACGVLSPGVVLDSSGTAEEILAASPDVSRIQELGREGFNVGCHVAAKRYYMAGGIPASGAAVDWFRNQFSPEASCGRAEGLLFFPHLRGGSSPDRNADSRGAFLGVRHFHTRADFQQAVYEGLSFEFRQGLLRLTKGICPEKIIAIGGGTKNRRWIETKASVTGLPIEIPAIQESTALGAAMLSGIGAGIYASAEDAAARVYRVGETVRPNPALREAYERKFLIFSQVYEALLPLNQQLSNL